MFVKTESACFTAALVYVDDVLLTGNCPEEIHFTKLALHNQFTIKDLDLARYFLGIEIQRNGSGTLLNQRKYILDILSDTGLTGCKPASFPLPQGLKLSSDSGSPIAEADTFRRLIGRLLYLTMTIPDISYAVQHLSQLLSSPKEPHMQAALRFFDT